MRMKLELKNTALKLFLLLSVSFCIVLFLTASALQFFASVFSERSDLSSLERAVRLQPYNAESHYRLGVASSFSNPKAAAQALRAAVSLDPYDARYWLALARVESALGDLQSQDTSLQNALKMGPTDPSVLWEAANTYFSRGEMQETLDQCRRLLADDGDLFGSALPFCWRVKPDADLFVSRLLPHKVDGYISFLDLLISKQDTSATAKAWEQLVEIGQPVSRPRVFQYVRYLIEQKRPDLAAQVWRQAGPLADLSSYQPSHINLIVNGDFDLPVLNGGFDWSYEKSRNISLALDPMQHEVGKRSLSISFDGAQIEDAGICQLVPVRPNATYDFSANFRAQQMEGAGGIRFVLQDAYDGMIFFAGNNMTNTDEWQRVNGTFTVGPDTHLLIARLQRVPAGDVIKGKLWIDGVRMVEQSQQAQ
jgi:tetratricopeptide (TPR) repeat protein